MQVATLCMLKKTKSFTKVNPEKNLLHVILLSNYL